jgi:signal peptidase I
MVMLFCLGKDGTFGEKISTAKLLNFLSLIVLCVLCRCPSNHKDMFVKRLIALPGEWMQLPGSRDVVKIPEGHCWVEGDNSARSWDSRAFGPVSYFSRSVSLVWVYNVQVKLVLRKL